LIVAGPGIDGKQVCNRPAELLDIYPTLLELASLPMDDDQEGQSLVPLLDQPDQEWSHPAITSFGKGNYSVRTTRYRYIRYVDGSEELYDHQSDPNEWFNLAGDADVAEIINDHTRYLPASEHEILPGNSTGHSAYAASQSALAQPSP
ncbi:MAG: sulfatase/phosphatase domain-containing protein, partial [Planctomycetota bacterium]